MKPPVFSSAPHSTAKPALRTVAPATPRRFDPVVIAFAPAATPKRSLAPLTLLVFLACLLASATAGGAAIWFLRDVPQHQSSVPALPAATATAASAPAETANTPPQLAVEPLPTIFITGRDFHSGTFADKPVPIPAAPPEAPAPEETPLAPSASIEKIPILPLLEQLPVGRLEEPARTSPARPAMQAAMQIDVDDLTPQRHLSRQAERAALEGRVDSAIALYGKLLRRSPSDSDARHNMAALLLEKAGRADERGDRAEALNAYRRALVYLPQNSADAASIVERMAFLQE